MTFDAQLSAERTGEEIGGIEPETGPFSGPLRREKRFKKMGARELTDPRSFVTYLQREPMLTLLEGERNPPLWRSVERILDQVDRDLNDWIYRIGERTRAKVEVDSWISSRRNDRQRSLDRGRYRERFAALCLLWTTEERVGDPAAAPNLVDNEGS